MVARQALFPSPRQGPTKQLIELNASHSYRLRAVCIIWLCVTSCSPQQNELSSTDISLPESIDELTISQVHQEFRRGTFSAEDLTRAYIRRIEGLDQSSELNAIQVIDHDAISKARELDREFETTGILRPLHGIPVVVKDNMDVKGLPTTAGSVAMRYAYPPNDAFIVARLRTAGAVVIAKSNMAEWAFSPLHTAGSSFGFTRNPYDLSRVPGGSSGGTASAIAANFAVVGMGTDTGNSVRGPAAHTDLVGLRPSLGLVSREGIIPLFIHYDTAGPMARTVEDVARVMDVIVGLDAADPITRHAEIVGSGEFFSALNENSLEDVRIGVLRTLFEPPNVHPDVSDLMELALWELEQAGSSVVDLRIPDLQARQAALWCDTFRYDVNQYLSSLGVNAPMSDVVEVIDKSSLYAPYLHDRLKYSVAIEASPDEQDPPCSSIETDVRRIEFQSYVDAHMKASNVDILVYPTWAYPPRRIWDFESPHGNSSFHIAPHTGYPAITVPMGHTKQGLPVGLQFLGRRFSDTLLVSYAYAYEQRTHHRRTPSFPPSEMIRESESLNDIADHP